MITAALLLALQNAAVSKPPSLAPSDRGSEGDWTISDTTDNNTGVRDVYALNLYIDKSADGDFVTVTLRCSEGKPVMFVEWVDLNLADQTVITITPDGGTDYGKPGTGYVFSKSTDVLQRGWKATPEDSARIVKSLAAADFMAVTAHKPEGKRMVVFNAAGTTGAWSRVSRHCPAPTLPKPPL
jgi:hypothetical protein